MKIKLIWSRKEKHKGVIFLLNEETDTYIECGPGTVLSGLIKKIVPEKIIKNISNLDSLNEYSKLYKSVVAK